MSLMTQKERSLKNGAKIEVGNTIYIGRNPSYQLINGIWMKAVKGIPWVKA